MLWNFNPRSPWGERRKYPVLSTFSCHFNPRSPWGERLLRFLFIEILQQYFNPRSPWGERPCRSSICLIALSFQSTLPVGGATLDQDDRIRRIAISIHAPRGGSDASPDPENLHRCISIHAPRGGSDGAQPVLRLLGGGISIHAPRGGSDSVSHPCMLQAAHDFNPRSPWGERPYRPYRSSRRLYFNPRSPWGERPYDFVNDVTTSTISIHAPRGGSDCKVYQTSSLSESKHSANFDNFPIYIPMETSAISQNSAAYAVRIPLCIHVFLGFALKDQRLVHLDRRLGAEMFRLFPLAVIQIIEPQ